MISSPNNATIRRIRRLRKRAERTKRGAFIAEGHRSVGVALSTGTKIETVLHSPDSAKRHRQLLLDAADGGARVLEAGDKVLRALSSAAHPPDVVAVVRMPAPARPGTGPILVLDKVRDPATVGSLLASAAASGIKSAVTVRGTADVYSSTAVRVAAGAHFVVALSEADTLSDSLASAPGARPVTLSSEGPPPWALDLSGPVAFIVGDDSVPESGDTTSIPPGPDGLAAPLASRGAVVLFEARRQRESK